MSTQELTRKLEDLQQLRRMAEDLAAEIDATQDLIKAHMTANGIEELSAGAFRVSWHAVSSSRIDTKSLAADYPEIAQAYTKVSTTRRFVVR